MSLNLPLSQQDRNLLTEQKEKKQEENAQIEENNEMLEVETGHLLLVDIPFKKQTDAPHTDILEYEEERRRLNGTSIVKPLDNIDFEITDTVVDSRLFLKDGRLIIEENGSEAHNVPLIPMRGSSKSQDVGTDFDIWTRDRYGSSTSKKNASSIFTITSSNSRFRAEINGEEQEVDIESLVVLPQDLQGETVGATIQGLLNAIEVGFATSSLTEPFMLDDGNQIGVSVDSGALQTITFNGTAGYTESVTSVSTKFAIGEEINDKIDFVEGTNTFEATLTPGYYSASSLATEIETQLNSLGSETYTVSYGSTKFTISSTGTFDLLWATGDNRRKNVGESIGFDILADDVGLSLYTADNEAAFNVVTKLNDEFNIIVNGVANNIPVRLDEGVYNLVGIVNEIQNQITERFGQQVTITSYSSGLFRVTSVGKGYNASIAISESTGRDFAIMMEMIGNVPVNGTGDFANMLETTAAELAGVLNTWTGVTVTDESGTVVITHDGSSKFEVSDGTGNPNVRIGLSEHVILTDGNSGFQTCSLYFNPDFNMFTLISGTAGPSSTVEVLNASSNDIQTTIGFDSQYQIVGKYANNLLNVEIDGEAQEIKLSDFRLCFTDTERGYVNDDQGVFWTGSLDTQLGYLDNQPVGPLLCSGVNNGSEVARSIAAGLNAVGTGGFERAAVHYFSDDNTFVIFSGTFGVDSSVKVLAASDPDRDARTLLGFNPPAEEIGNEDYYYTLADLAAILNTFPNVSASPPIEGDRISHSVLYNQDSGSLLGGDFQSYALRTTPEYDEAARGNPRLFPDGELVVDSSNNKLNFWETANIELTVTIPSGNYNSPAQLAEIIQNELNSVGDSEYVVEQDINTEKITIESDGSGGAGIFSLLWQTGIDRLSSIGNEIGFDINSDDTGSLSYTSDRVVSFGPDVDNFSDPVMINQFDGDPKAVDDTVDELSSMNKEEELLNSEESISSLLSDIQNATSYDNEVRLDGWELLAAYEFAKVLQEYNAIKAHRGAYANHISESDAIIAQKTAALNNLVPNYENLEDLLTSHGNLVNLNSETAVFVPGVDFTQDGTESLVVNVSGPNDKKIYNRPAPLVQYTGEAGHIPGRWSPVGLFGTMATFVPEQLVAFRLTNTRTGTKGYSYTPTDVDGFYTILYGADTVASLISDNSEPYDLSGGNDILRMRIDGGAEQTAIVDATSGYTESSVAVESGFVVSTGVNDKLDFSEGHIAAETTNTIDETYALEDGDQLEISIDGGANQVVQFDATTGYINGNSITSAFPVQTGVNDKINFEETIGTELTVTLTQGNYTGFSLAFEIQTKLNAAGSSTYSVSYDDLNNNFVLLSDLIGGGGVFRLLWSSGTNSATTVGPTIGFVVDSTGSPFYFSQNQVEFVVLSNYNDQFQIAIDGVTGAGLITISSGYYSSNSLATEIQTQILNDVNFTVGDITVSYIGSSFRLESGTKGTGSTVVLTSAVRNFLPVIGMTAATPVNGTGDFVNIAQATASEVATKLDSSWTGVTVSAVGLRVKVVHDTIGDYNFQIVDGTGNPNTQLGFSTAVIQGQGDLSITIPDGAYTGAGLVSQIQTLMNATGGSSYTLDYDVLTTDKITFISDGSGGTGIFDLVFSNSQSIAFTIGFNSVDKTGNLTYVSDNVVEFTVLTGVNDEFTIEIDGVASAGAITIGQANWLTSGLITEISTQIANDASFNSSEFTVTYPGNKFRITSTTKGTDSTVEVAEGINDFLRTISLDGDVPVVGGGDVGDITAVTAAEVANVLNSEINGVSSSDVGGRVKIDTVSAKGTISAILMTGGTALPIIGFSSFVGTPVIGNNQDNKLKVNINGDTSQDPIEIINGVSSISGTIIASSIQTQLQIIGSGGYGAATCTFNETTLFQTFNNALRILSGTYGTSSTVDVTDRTIKIIAGTNDKIDFEETPGNELTATLTPGFYDGAELASEIQTQLNAVGSSNYTISYDGTFKKMIMTSNGIGGAGIFRILWNSGTNAASNVHDEIAFYNSVDNLGSLSYTSDGLVKLQSAIQELGFDSQTVEPGHDVDSVNVTLDDSAMTGILVWSDNGGGTRLDLSIDITTAPEDKIDGLVSTINTVDFYSASYDNAYLVGRVAEKFRLANADTLIVNANSGVAQTITFVCSQGQSQSGTGFVTRIYSGVNDRLRVTVNGYGPTEITLGTQLSPDKIAEKIQQEVRNINPSNVEIQAGFLSFTCEFTGSRYLLKSGTSGTGSSVVVTDAATNNVADLLRLGTANGGTESGGTGDFVNSDFVTLVEVNNKINGVASGFAASGPNYIRLDSTVSGSSSRLQVSGTAIEKLGFDNNDDDFPQGTSGDLSSQSLEDFTNVNVQSPNEHVSVRGWQVDKGNVEIDYSVIDDSEVINRKSVVSTRLPTIPSRRPEIVSRAAAINSLLTPVLYDSRKEAVQLRLNKDNGSYVKVGDKYNQIERNNETIDTNQDYIDEIDTLL